MKETDIAWLAGLLEGEGCFYYTTTPSISLTMSDFDVIERAHNLMGYGAIRERRVLLGRKRVWSTECRGYSATKLMRLLLPHMGMRRRQSIEAVLEAIRISGIERSWIRGFDPRWKITPDHIPAIQYLHDEKGLTFREISRICNVHPKTINRHLLDSR